MTRLYTISPTKPATFVHFDWLTLVYPVDTDELERLGMDVECYVDDVLNRFGLDSKELVYDNLKHGIYFYDHARITGNESIIIAWYDTDRGYLPEDKCNFMIQMSGAGVESLESILDLKGLTVADFIKTSVNKYQATFSRVDACNNFFNYGKKYSAKYADEQASKGNLVTRAQTVTRIAQYPATGEDHSLASYLGADQGYTTYIGKNPKQLRIYNKLAERASKVNLLYGVKSWSRWEYQLNGVQAQGFIENYLKRDCDLVQTWVDWLATNYRFITRNGKGVSHQAKRSRYPNATWFDNLIKTASEKTYVRTEKQKPTFERATKWIRHSVVPTLASIIKARQLKYMQNGVCYEDAHELAFKKVMADTDLAIMNDDTKDHLISTWLKEEGESID